MATLQAGNISTEATCNHAPVLDTFTSDLPFDLSSRAVSTEFQISYSLIDVTWDGDLNTFPPFLVSIKTKVIEMHWDNRTTGITDVNGKDLFSDYCSIAKSDIATSKAARTSDRAIQNACGLYKEIQTSLTGYIKTQIFSRNPNIPSMDDGL